VRITFVDVGQGDAIIIRSGRWTGLVDGGPRGSDGTIEAQLAKAGVQRLDTLIVTHPDLDHVGGLPLVVADYRPRRVLLSGGSSTQAWAAAWNAMKRAGATMTQVDAGDRFRFGKATVQVLNPQGPTGGGGSNETSVVLLLTVAGKRILLPGDLQGPNELAVGRVLARGPPLFLLKVAHHGSRYSTGATFLDEARPRFAVICVGRNSYGHPSPDTLARLRDDGVRVYSTQKNGTITLTIAASGKATWRFSRSAKAVTSTGGGGSSAAGGGDGGSATGGASGSTVVYITATGECYHRASCRYLSQSKIRISLRSARSQGYRPCSVCDPPR
jgi:competence protein ComEC